MLKKSILSLVALVILAFAIWACSNDSKIVSNESTNTNNHPKPASGYVIPSDRYYSEDNLWVKMLDDSTGIIGVTGPGISSTNPAAEIGEDIPVRILHPPKTHIFDIKGGLDGSSSFAGYSPVNGTFVAWNSAISSSPSLISSDPYNAGWILKVTGIAQSDLKGLMNASQYSAFIGQ